MSTTPSSLHVVFPDEGEQWNAFLARIAKLKGDVLLVVADRDEELGQKADVRAQLIASCAAMGRRVRIATKNPAFVAEARAKGIRVIDRTKDIHQLLKGHALSNEVFRVFSPHQWKQQLQSQLQRMGLLSVPKLRIYALVLMSVLLFFFVLFRLLPSADVTVWPRQETASQTVNVYLVSTGSLADVPSRVRTMPLIPIGVTVKHSLVSDHIGKEFIGTTAEVDLTVVNTASEEYSFKKGTRFTNEAGMVFRAQEPIFIPAGKEVAVRAKADDVDIYGQIIGARGNVPPGLTWKIPGLSDSPDRQKIYAKNAKAAKGGTTAYRTVLMEEDLELAKRKLEQELLTQSRGEIGQVLEHLHESHPESTFILLHPNKYPELTRMAFSGVVLPTALLGQSVESITVSGEVQFTAFAYDAKAIFDFLQAELQSHVREGKYLLEDNVGTERLVAHVIAYDDELSWIKLTVDLTGTEQYILDPLLSQGALFAKRLRERVAGLPTDEALRIIKNMPEVENAAIGHWPPWNRTMPRIPSHISVIPQL